MDRLPPGREERRVRYRLNLGPRIVNAYGSKGFLCDFALYVPATIAAMYSGTYLAMYFGFYQKVEHLRHRIRIAVANKWTKHHGTLLSIIDDVPVKYIRVLVKPAKREDIGLRALQVLFGIASTILFFVGIVVKNTNGTRYAALSVFFLLALLYTVVLTALLLKSWSELRFYLMLRDLAKDTGIV